LAPLSTCNSRSSGLVIRGHVSLRKQNRHQLDHGLLHQVLENHKSRWESWKSRFSRNLPRATRQTRLIRKALKQTTNPSLAISPIKALNNARPSQQSPIPTTRRRQSNDRILGRGEGRIGALQEGSQCRGGFGVSRIDVALLRARDAVGLTHEWGGRAGGRDGCITCEGSWCWGGEC
jgi:hypothetical protein